MRKEIKQLKAKGISYSLIAKRANVSRSLISKYVNEQCNLSEESEAAIKAALDEFSGVDNHISNKDKTALEKLRRAILKEFSKLSAEEKEQFKEKVAIENKNVRSVF